MQYDLELKSEIVAQDSGLSLIDYMTDRFTYKTREHWANLIEKGNISLDGKKAFSNSILSEGMILTFLLPDYFEPDLDTNYHKVFENENIIIVSKPANLPISSNHKFFKQNMTALLREQENLPDINPIHRIDRETSGLIIYLKKRFEAPRALRKEPLQIVTGKYYLAIVKGKVTEKSFSCNIPLMDSKDSQVGYKVTAAEPGKGKEASTFFSLLGNTEEYSLLLANLKTGRKHQIRAHCSLLGFPIVGDKLYSHDSRYFIKRRQEDFLSDEDYEILGSTHHLLHAYALRLNLPGKEPELITSEFFSQEFQKYLDLFPNWRRMITY